MLLDASIQVVDEYLNDNADFSAYKEPKFAGNINAWFKSERIGKNSDATANLNSLMALHKAFFTRAPFGQLSPREIVKNAISGAGN